MLTIIVGALYGIAALAITIAVIAKLGGWSNPPRTGGEGE